MNKPIKVAIASQKGGSGKSTLTMLLGNMLYFEKGKKVMILDCDIPQNTNMGIRTDELRKLGTIHEKRSSGMPLEPGEKLLWKYFESSIAEFPRVKEDFLIKIPKTEKGDILSDVVKQIPDYEKMGYDVILFDTVGSISNGSQLLTLMQHMDYIFVPIETEESALKPAISSLIAFRKLNENISVYGFFNKFKSTEKEQYRCMCNVLAIAGQMQLPLLLSKTQHPLYAEDKACFRSSYVKSSMFSAARTKAYKQSEGYNLIDEMCKIILKK